VPGIAAAVLLALLGVVGTISLYSPGSVAPQLWGALLWGAVGCVGFILVSRVVILVGIWVAIAALLARRGAHALSLMARTAIHGT